MVVAFEVIFFEVVLAQPFAECFIFIILGDLGAMFCPCVMDGSGGGVGEAVADFGEVLAVGGEVEDGDTCFVYRPFNFPSTWLRAGAQGARFRKPPQR